MSKKLKKQKRKDNARFKDYKQYMKETLLLHLEWHYKWMFGPNYKPKANTDYEWNGWTFQDFIKDAAKGMMRSDYYENSVGRIKLQYENMTLSIFDDAEALTVCLKKLNQRI